MMEQDAVAHILARGGPAVDDVRARLTRADRPLRARAPARRGRWRVVFPVDTVALAEIFSVPPGTIRVWLHRARTKLRTLLGRDLAVA